MLKEINTIKHKNYSPIIAASKGKMIPTVTMHFVLLAPPPWLFELVLLSPPRLVTRDRCDPRLMMIATNWQLTVQQSVPFELLEHWIRLVWHWRKSASKDFRRATGSKRSLSKTPPALCKEKKRRVTFFFAFYQWFCWVQVQTCTAGISWKRWNINITFPVEK